MKLKSLILVAFLALFVACCGYKEGGIRYSVFDDLVAGKYRGYLVNHAEEAIEFEVWSIRQSYFEFNCNKCDSAIIYKDVVAPEVAFKLELKPGWYLIKIRPIRGPSEPWRMFHKQLKYKRPDKGPFTWEYELRAGGVNEEIYLFTNVVDCKSNVAIFAKNSLLENTL